MDISDNEKPGVTAIEPWDESRADGATGSTHQPVFHARLRHVIAQSGKPLLAIARASGLHHATLHGWATGRRHPLPASIPRVQAVERALDLPAGTLTELISIWVSRLETKTTPQGEYTAACLADRYLLKFRDWPEAAKEEWQRLCTLKTQSPLFGASPAEDQSYWTEEDGHCASARKTLTEIESFYGWLLRARGFSADAMSFALLADINHIAGYIEFRRSRSYGQCFSHQVPYFLGLVSSLVRAKTGLLWIEPDRFACHPHFGGRFLPAVVGPGSTEVTPGDIPTGWRAHLDALGTRIRLESKRLRKLNVVRSSRPREQFIERILEHPAPWSILFLCEHRMLRDPIPPSLSPLHRAIRAQTRLIFRLLVRYGFRRSTLARTRLGDVNLLSGALVLPKQRFKNRRYLDVDWRTILDPSLIEDVREFVRVHRPRLLAGRSSSRLLVCSGEENMSNLLQTISNASALISGQFIPEWTEGFRPHAIRHIIATHLIKRDPVRGFHEAAVALWDKVATIEKTYAHLKTVLFQSHHESLADHAQREGVQIAKSTARQSCHPAPPDPAAMPGP